MDTLASDTVRDWKTLRWLRSLLSVLSRVPRTKSKMTTEQK
jgi:hypothetical protein